MASNQECNSRKGPWDEDEDELLKASVIEMGEGRWESLAQTSGLLRSGKSCRLRWLNYLRPNLKQGRMSVEEEEVIIRLQQQLGNKWSRIARMLPGRTDNEIKNYWRTRVRRQQWENRKLESYVDGRLSCEQESSSAGTDESRSMSVSGHNVDKLSIQNITDDDTHAQTAASISDFGIACSPYEAWMLAELSNYQCDGEEDRIEAGYGSWDVSGESLYSLWESS
uniref:Uncharacterized protein n=1 Tax=Kalanchoe fedtschenkoi TaxID=63787 RepID=A0A7N0R9G4_KALFE